MFVKYSMSDLETFSFNHKAHLCNLKELSRLLIESFLYELQGYQKGTHPHLNTPLRSEPHRLDSMVFFHINLAFKPFFDGVYILIYLDKKMKNIKIKNEKRKTLIFEPRSLFVFIVSVLIFKAFSHFFC